MLLPPNKKPADSAEANEKRNLVKRNLLKPIRKWLNKEKSEPNCRERTECDTPCNGRATRVMP